MCTPHAHRSLGRCQARWHRHRTIMVPTPGTARANTSLHIVLTRALRTRGGNCVFTLACSTPSWDTGLPHYQHSHRHRRQRKRDLGGRPAPPVHRLLEEGEAAQVGVRVGGRLLRFEQRRTAAIRCSGVLAPDVECRSTGTTLTMTHAHVAARRR